MNKKIELLKWMLEINLDKTRDLFCKNIETCHCLYCENYIEASKFFEPAVMEVFHALGINASKPSHLSEFGEIENGLYLYMGSYHLVGKLIEGEYCTDSKWKDNNTARVENFTFGFNQELTFVHDDFPKPVLQLDFEARIPWVLSEKPEDE